MEDYKEPVKETPLQPGRVEADAGYGNDLRSVPRDLLGDAAAHLLFWGAMFGIIDDSRYQRMTGKVERFVAAGHKEDPLQV